MKRQIRTLHNDKARFNDKDELLICMHPITQQWLT